MTQFLVMVLLNFVAAIVGGIGSCRDASSTYDCVSGVGIELLYVILLAVWFGFVWVLAYAAQDRRDHRLAIILMGAEGMILAVSLFNAQHYPNILGLIISLADASFAVWVIWLAFKLTRAKGGRITTTPKRRRPSSKI
jgi:hypothetical protein